MNLQLALESLRDVQGVHGSFVLDEAGVVVQRDMPRVFGDDTLSAAAPRCQRLGELFDSLPALGQTRSLWLRYGSYQLHLRHFGGGALCVLAAGNANAAALQVAANLVARRAESALGERSETTMRPPAVAAPASAGPFQPTGRASSLPPPPVQARPPALSTAAETARNSQPPGAPTRQLTYRGRPVD